MASPSHAGPRFFRVGARFVGREDLSAFEVFESPLDLIVATLRMDSEPPVTGA